MIVKFTRRPAARESAWVSPSTALGHTKRRSKGVLEVLKVPFLQI